MRVERFKGPVNGSYVVVWSDGEIEVDGRQVLPPKFHAGRRLGDAEQSRDPFSLAAAGIGNAARTGGSIAGGSIAQSRKEDEAAVRRVCAMTLATAGNADMPTEDVICRAQAFLAFLEGRSNVD